MALITGSPSVHTPLTRRSTLTTSLEGDGGRTVIVLRGEADVATRATMADVLSQVIRTPGGDIIVDMAGLDFIDSGSLHAIEMAQQLLHYQGRELTVRAPSQMAARILGFLGLAQLSEPPVAA